MQASNAGWLFYKDYYQQINFRAKKEDENNEKLFKDKNAAIFKQKFDPACLASFVRSKQSLHFKTTYPGLLIGSGYNHETGYLGEIKIGFHFDHSTGMPYLPGSSVKGVLRAPFEGSKKENEPKHFKHLGYLQHIFQATIGKNWQASDFEAFELSVFEGAGHQNMYQHDVFLDAVITQGDSQGYFLDSDFITPHRKPGLLRNPIPIQFLKIRPGVEISFYFELRESGGLRVEEKKKVFERIIRDLGVGAKTNVGYGNLEFLVKK